MTILRHCLGLFLVLLAELIARSNHHLCHAGAWLMDHNIEDECEQCRLLRQPPPDDWAT
ncbi:MAG: hypothetical protein ACREYE_14665 [Gammaproteobacteria bacterium]